MIDLKLLRESPDLIRQALKNRGVDIDIEKILGLEKERRFIWREVEDLRSQRNEISSQKGKPADIETAKKIKGDLRVKEDQLKIIEQGFEALYALIPNIPLDDVPVGQSEEDKKVIREWGKAPKFDFEPKDHTEIGKGLDLIDAERAAKISGARFGILKNEAALMEFALINMAMDALLKEGFTPIIPPTLIRPEMMQAMGYVDTEEDRAERYFLEKDNLYLVGTAEQALGPMHQGEIFDKDELPKRYMGFSSCFREEAGSYGKDTKGIFRVHQFDKVEMFSFTKPQDSKEEHQFLISLEEKLMQKLGLPYRLVHLCTADMARPSASTYDIEVWIPSQKRYRELMSSSNCTDFQARRLGIRHKEGDKTEFVHTLNATAFAMGRTIIAILENYQQKDGRVLVPKALRKYLGKKYIARQENSWQRNS
ncbi:MAG: serine--tRNA ligase [Parcubacteria group bacterium CG08_land_8_20_14_0_20_43_9]|nr:MAG: serine--tRNA ligase [Parcubacteria group bacterium CG08_land_8_20_14_0_20_43_9]